ncbi:ribonuclease J [Alteromonas gilva]|uniref:Ribonuclease J n=1 Tax=Alteromonas gilva TaxID=2987522 RepID=A0ABT5L113_9ALTE|nr:ribonuclease J [Alteromonas gilva]MDC8830714.1 ribonuclease J [Alteromonas gilva]
MSKENTISALVPGDADFWFLPLGGTGEIGMNLNLYGHAGQWLMVDCGVTFDESLQAPYLDNTATTTDKHSIVAPDPAFIVEQRERLAGLVLTHGHEDHIGAVAALWPRLRCPVYATPFTAEILYRKLGQAGLVGKVPVQVVNPDDNVKVGPFVLSWLDITHSIPEPQALLIATDAGTVLHTADWKIDAQPITGKPFDAALYRELGQQNLLALVGDSTNALKPGFSISERICAEGLSTLIRQCPGRVVVSCFGSNVARLISIARIAQKTGRYLGLLGRSLENMLGVARKTGYWPEDLEIIDRQHLGYLPPNEVLVVATGSQGESRAALNRLAIDGSPYFELAEGDTVIFSSIVIPGNETAVERLTEKLKKKKINVIQSEHSEVPIHASGHPCAEELKLMYQWTKPGMAIPVHGEPEHLQAHADIARSMGIRRTYVGRNGDLYLLAPQPGIRRQRVPAGRIALTQR